MQKSSEHLLDPELRDAIAGLPDIDFDAVDLPSLRTMIAARHPGSPSDNDVDVHWETVQREDGGSVKVLCYRPREISSLIPAIIHTHGGGFVLGQPEGSHAQHRNMAKTLGCAIYSVKYRLAPDTAFPGALEDAYTVLNWVYRNAAGINIDPARIALKGESAGGCLAAGLTMLARDRGEIPLIFQALTFPALDDRTGSVTHSNPYSGQYIWTPKQNIFGWSSYLGAKPGGTDTPAYAAPGRASDLSRLPPAFIGVGALDLYMDEDLDYARRLCSAGIPVELHVYPGAVHGFTVDPNSRVAKVFERDLQDALRRAFSPGTASR